MRKSFWISVPLLAMALIVSPACKAPAEFEVMSLDVTPLEVTAGDTVSITAEVENIGGSEGVYTAILTVDGVEVETKDIGVAPGTTETVTFSLVKEEVGTYKVAVGELGSSLTVKEKEPVFVAKEVELKYDDGDARGWLAWVGGYLVDFSPPTIPLTIEKVQIYGCLYGSGWEDFNFEVEIWDKDGKVLHGATYSVTKFTTWPPTWVEVEVPDIEVTDQFYVHIWRGICKGSTSADGLLIGVDDSVLNEHSETTIRTEEGATDMLGYWPYGRTHSHEWFGDKSKVNWMIRVVGTCMVPEE